MHTDKRKQYQILPTGRSKNVSTGVLGKEYMHLEEQVTRRVVIKNLLAYAWPLGEFKTKFRVIAAVTMIAGSKVTFILDFEGYQFHKVTNTI